MNDENKLKSRKFIVWLIWSILTVTILILCYLAKDKIVEIAPFLEKLLGYYFGISAFYVGANATQKIGGMIADSLSGGSDNAE